MSRLQVSELQRAFQGRQPVHALRSVSLEVETGSLLAVLGPSGCGKTTLLRTIAGMERPDSGEIRLGDRLLDGAGVHVTPEKRAIGLVPQEGALFPHLDVAGNVGFGLQRLKRPARRARIEALLELVGLPSLGSRRPHQLSGGQQQRVAVARALAPSPEVVLLDEPFSALDTGLRSALREEVSTTLRESGTTAMLVTHDQIEAMTMSDTLAVMRDGRLVQVGRPDEVYRRPVDSWTARFIGDAILLPAQRCGPHTARGPLGTVALASDFENHDATDVVVFCRPEQLRPVRSDEPGADAEVTSVRFQGPDAMITLSVDGHVVSARWPSALLPQVGDSTRVAVVGEALAYPPAARDDHGDADADADVSDDGPGDRSASL